ncbi:MAG: DEAD/DEAH box helicase [Kiritimatiellia bacterium]
MQERPYQTSALSSILDEWGKGIFRTLLVLPTGTGKTIVFCKLLEVMVSRGARCLILAHRGELLDQAADKLSRSTGLGCSVEKAEQSCIGEWYRVVIGSVQTLMRPNRLKLFSPDFFDVIVVDEAHHVLSDSYLRVLNHFEGAKVLGVTATPDRGDMRNLGQFFESLAFEYSLPQAIGEGYLVPIKAQTIPLQIDIAGIKKTGGDYNAGALGNALDPYLDQIAQEIQERCAGRKTVVFTPLIATSKKLLSLLLERDVKAFEVNGKSKDRAAVIQRFDMMGPGVLLNSMLLTEGWDCPSVDCIIVLRATKVRSLYCQMVGRGTRLSPGTGKKNLLLLDFLWHSDNHELCRPAHIICESAEVAETMTDDINGSAFAVDLVEALPGAEQETINKREEALADKLRNLQHKKAKLVDPLQFEMSIQSEELAGYIPAFGWESEKPNEKQLDALEAAGIFPGGVESAGKAEKLLKTVEARKSSGLASPLQIRFLEQRGFRHVGQWWSNDAKKLVDRIAANRWHIPRGINPVTYVPNENAKEMSYYEMR